MDLKMKKQLLEKYWNGETTPAEEQWLRANVSEKDEGLTKEELRYFEQLNAFVDLSPTEKFDMTMFEEPPKEEAKIVSLSFYQGFRKYAVMALMVFTLGIGSYYFTPSDETVTSEASLEEEDPEKAFEMAKASLMLISQKMNKGTTHINALGKFEATSDKINSKKNQ